MNIIFAGTPEIALPVLKALHASEHNILAVMTQPDRPAGRGKKLTASPIKQFAQEHNLPLYQPASLKTPDALEAISSLASDLIVVMAYGMMFPSQILSLPKFGCVNLHVSLLPRWRGAAPIQRAILAGDKLTGVTLMQMDEGLDDGAIIDYKTLDIAPLDTALTLHSKLSELAVDVLMNNLVGIADQSISLTKQDDSDATYAAKISKEEACINWSLSAQQIERSVRAYNPFPVAYTFLEGERMRVWESTALNGVTEAPAGTILAADKVGLDVSCGANVLRITKIQWAGRNIQTIQDALNAHHSPLIVGKQFCADE